tara:strand:- start:368404 stop:370602 length:2199 start_codon:yes stop_codon:yes gene_type:complete
MPILRLAIPSPLRRLFDYLPPADMTAEQAAGLLAGARLKVPFGSRELTGYLVDVVADGEPPEQPLKAAIELLDAKPLLPPALLQLARWASDYYLHPQGEVLGALFPRRLREGAPHQALTDTGWRLTVRGKGLPEGALARSPKQAQALALLQQAQAVTRAALKEQGIQNAVMRALHDKGLVEQCDMERQRVPAKITGELTLNSQQTTVMASLKKHWGAFSCHLLEGVTGSGKTEVYLQLIADCLQRSEQALVLIPEIGLTPQTLQRFKSRFNTEIAVLHSGLADGQRYSAWEAARSGAAPIVIGTRSAIFTPLLKPGLIIVDEEHDSSYKQQDGFRYSARDVAVKRAQLEGCPVLLGSATPSLETAHNAQLGRYVHHVLNERAGGSTLPDISTLDVRRQPLQAGLSESLLEAVDEHLSAGRQALLFLNRRGYAPTLQCHDCGWIAQCTACDARLTVHRRERRLRCHHCGAGRPLPGRCPECHSQRLLSAGLGTQQTEDFLHQRFRGTPIYRVDSDTMSGRDAMQDLVDEINRGEPCILLGTQMLTKGHHFPAVSLVAVVDSDAMLFSADFRCEERMAQLLTQVAGRAGRAQARGKVILQTHYPDHPAMLAMLSQTYAEQVIQLLEQRRASGMPPAGQLVLLRTDCKDLQWGEAFLAQLRRTTAPLLPEDVALIGPLPAPMQRRAGKFRSQLLLLASSRRAGHMAARVMVDAAEQLPQRLGLKWTIDIDPLDLF